MDAIAVPENPILPPLAESEFDRIMDRFAPFEPCPEIAVGVSGGADSMALALLAHRWAGQRGGTATALIVDHGLRPDSAKESRQVGKWLARRGIRSHRLEWLGAKPRSAIQARARDARFALLTEWCREHGVLHLLLAHHLQDQAETFLLRLARASGTAGLACMPGITETHWLRILRPLLRVPRQRLRAVLRARGQEWLEDPSNTDDRFTRVRIRRQQPALAELGFGPGRIAATAAHLAYARADSDRETASLLARCVAPHPAGFCIVDVAELSAARRDVGLRALGRVAMCVGGLIYPPRSERLERLYDALIRDGSGRARTLGGCLFMPRRGRLVVTREWVAQDSPPLPQPGAETLWDGRMRIRVSDRLAPTFRDCRITALGRTGWSQIRRDIEVPVRKRLPPSAWPTVPAIRWGNRANVVHYIASWSGSGDRAGDQGIEARFWPVHPLATVPFSVV